MNKTNPPTPLRAVDPLHRFSERVEDYARHRPNYPATTLDTILEGLYASPSPLVAADIGAGTGIASRQLAERSVCVLAVEPDPAMRQAATPHLQVEFREGTAEVTHLPDASVDLVTCFQSFHWFDFRESLLEFRRILKPSGRLALVWNHWDTSDRFTASYVRLVNQAAANQLTRFLANVLHLVPSYFIKHLHIWLRLSLRYLPNFVKVRRYKFAFKHELDLSGLIGLAMSQSTTPLSGPAQVQLVSNLQELYERSCPSGNFVGLAYRTTLYLAEPLNKDE